MATRVNKYISKYKSLPVQVRASFWFLVCSFLQKGISSITTPIFTRLMTTAEYGRFGTFNSWMNLLTVFITLNLYSGVYVQGLVKFDDRRRQFASAMQGLSLTLSVGWTIVYLAFRGFWNGLFTLTTVQMLAMLVIIWTSSAFNFWAVEQRVALKYRHLVILTVFASLAKPILSIILVRSAQDKVTARILGITCINVLAFTWLFFVQLYRGKVFYSKDIWKYALKFNLPLLPHYLSMTVLSSSDRIMIRNMIGAEEAGIYNLAYQLSLIMTLFNTALLQTIEPWLFKKIKDRRIDEIARVAYPAFIFIGVINLFLIVLAPEMVAIFAPKAYYDAIWVIPPITISVVFMFTYSFFSAFEFYFEKTKYIMLATGMAAALNIALNYVFIRIFGYYAAAYTTLVCYALYTSFHYIFMRKICREHLDGAKPYDLKTLLLIGAVITAAGFAVMALYHAAPVRYGIVLAALAAALVKRKALMAALTGMLKLRKEAKKGA